MYVCMYICTVCMYVCMYGMYVCMYACTYICTYVRIYIRFSVPRGLCSLLVDYLYFSYQCRFGGGPVVTDLQECEACNVRM